MAMPWDFAAILLFLAVVVPFLGKRRMRRLLAQEKTTKRDRLRLYASTIVSQWLVVSIIVWRARAHRLTLAQLGLALPHVALAIGVTVALSALILTNQLLSLRQLALHPSEAPGMMTQMAARIFPQDNMERAAFVAVVVTVAICEEIIYRGFVQALFQEWSGAAVLAIVASGALFAIGHLYQGSRGVGTTFVVGLCFSTVRWWTGTLLPPVMSHFVADVTVGILAPGKLKGQRSITFALQLHI
jgi:membrane protease YdiL (CAAX protease family)